MNNFDYITMAFKVYPMEALFSIVLVAVPIGIWMLIFTQKQKLAKKAIIVSFIAGICSALIMFVYQYFWEHQLNFGFFQFTPVNFQQNIGAVASNFSPESTSSFAEFVRSQLFKIFLISLSIGLIEEYLKHWVVKKADHNYFTSVDDIIELSIIAALGFAFTENIIYLFREILGGGAFTGKFFSLFFLRSLFVVFVHILCSGIYGYYYGVGYYAGPILQEERMQGKKEIVPEFLHRVIHLKTSRIFHDEMVALGLVISTLIHGIFDFLMSVNWTLGGILGMESLKGVGIHTIVLPLYLILGFAYLSYLLDKKEDHEKFGHLDVKEVYVK